mgnify:CR=1 FL=1
MSRHGVGYDAVDVKALNARGIPLAIELAAARNHLVKVEPALEVEIDVPRHVDAEAVGAHETSLDALFEEQRESVHFDFLSERHHPDDRRDAARAEGLRFGVSEHVWGSYNWFATNKGLVRYRKLDREMRVYTEAEISAMSTEEFAKVQDDLMAAMAEAGTPRISTSNRR